jgi:glycosyltransferase involved in cell wall biosynthesis
MTSKTRVLMLLPNLNGGGIEKTFLHLYQVLDRDRIEPSILVHEKIGHFVDTLDDSYTIDFVNDREYRRTDLPGLLWATLQHARSTDVILAANEGRAAFLGLLAAKILNKPAIAVLNFNWSEFKKEVSWRQTLALKIYGWSDRIVACSQGTADSFLALVNLDPKLLEVIYTGMPASDIRQKAQNPLPDDIKDLFDKPTIVNVGRLDPQKGQEFLIAASAILLRQGLDFNVIIIGAGGLLDQLKQQAADLGIADSVHFLGYQTNHYRFVKKATLFCLSSRFEGAPLVLYEALICGTPVVSTDCPSGPAEILKGGEYGILVKSEDPEALAKGLAPVLTDTAKRQELSELALRRALDFDEKHWAERWSTLIESVRENH